MSDAQQIHASLEDNVQFVREQLGNSSDIVFKPFAMDEDRAGIDAVVIYTEGLVDSRFVQDFIMDMIMIDRQSKDTTEKSSADNGLIAGSQQLGDFESVFDQLMSGHIILLLEGSAIAYTIEMSSFKDRGVPEATGETVIRGPKEGFSESLRTNTTLIRRKIKNKNLWLETRKIGRVTQTDVSIMYIKGIVNDKVVEEVRERLDRIDIDAILESGYIEELIQDGTYSPFPTMYNTERPDVIAAELLEGKVAILVDGTPHVLVVPALFISFLHSAEDYYQRADISSLLRLLRFVGIFIALLVPALYIAITTYHHEMIPTQLLISLAAQREGIPFPAFIEALMMEAIFEILREAGIRMPKAIGQAVSIVGTLVIGQAAVEAGIVSAAMVIVVSITAISSFVVPSMNMSISIRMLRFPLMGLAASFGLFGIIVGLIALMLHLCSLRTFGIPYMSPFGPFNLADQKDTLFRLPQWAMRSRPRLINQTNMIRGRNPSKGERGRG
ncbi:GerA spore germination protein [Paenibacillus curdlanolyticus YK9]|uniref:GerA spore germination protein n=1 Tax=Paenibacillus curdlanolyticus YK9 TaxID=717606 RepID=E0I8B2_9BACL|nr:spore germination protein [Paenibacillus curdlanolyticus]EFM11417.1 GerA spore germination protein [Paenibacillus curdlanolyticus YK9]